MIFIAEMICLTHGRNGLKTYDVATGKTTSVMMLPDESTKQKLYELKVSVNLDIAVSIIYDLFK